MAWFDRSPGEKKSPSEERLKFTAEPVEPPTMPLPKAPEEALVAHLCNGSKVTGQLTLNGAAKIDGSVEGEVLCRGVLTIGEKAEVRAKIFGDVVIIRGRVDGDVVAKEKVALESPARLSGNVEAPRLVITEGVVFDGYCSMIGARDKGESPSAQRSSSEKAFEGASPKLFTELEK